MTGPIGRRGFLAMALGALAGPFVRDPRPQASAGVDLAHGPDTTALARLRFVGQGQWIEVTSLGDGVRSMVRYQAPSWDELRGTAR